MVTRSTLVGTLLLPLFGCVEPGPMCVVAPKTYAVRFTLTTSPAPTGACAQKQFERVGVGMFYPNPGAAPEVVLQPETISVPPSSALVRDSSSLSVGLLDSAWPDGNHFCTAPALTDASGKASSTGQAIGYHWTNVRFYVSPRIPGTQFTATVDYTEGGCTARYEATGVFPARSCLDGNGNPDVTLCSASSGSLPNFDPAFPLACELHSDPDGPGPQGICLLPASSSVPALRTNP